MTKPKTDRPFAERFEKIDDQVPMTKEEAKAILAEAGVDPTAGKKRLFAELEAIEADERQKRFARAEVSYQRDVSHISTGQADRARPEMLAQLDMYRASNPGLSTHFRDFKGANDEELRSLLAEIEELIRRDSKE